MTNKQAIAVILRVIGLWLSIKSLFVALIAIPHVLESTGSFTVTILSFLSMMIGAWLTVRPMDVTRILLPVEASEPVDSNWSIDEFQATMFSVLGAYFLVITVTDLAGWLRVWTFIQNATNAGAINSTYHELLQIGSLVLMFAAGCWLLLGAKGLRRMLRKLRS